MLLCQICVTPLDVISQRCTAAPLCAKIKERCVQTRNGGAHRRVQRCPSRAADTHSGFTVRRSRDSVSGYSLSTNRNGITLVQKCQSCNADVGDDSPARLSGLLLPADVQDQSTGDGVNAQRRETRDASSQKPHPRSETTPDKRSHLCSLSTCSV